MELLHNPSLMQVGRCRLVHTLYFTFVCVCLWQSLSLEAAILSSPCPLAGDPCLACHFSVWQLRVRQQSNRGRRGEEEEGHDLYLGNVETNGRNWSKFMRRKGHAVSGAITWRTKKIPIGHGSVRHPDVRAAADPGSGLSFQCTSAISQQRRWMSAKTRKQQLCLHTILQNHLPEFGLE